jgi:hypothetical protein
MLGDSRQETIPLPSPNNTQGPASKIGTTGPTIASKTSKYLDRLMDDQSPAHHRHSDAGRASSNTRKVIWSLAVEERGCSDRCDEMLATPEKTGKVRNKRRRG